MELSCCTSTSLISSSSYLPLKTTTPNKPLSLSSFNSVFFSRKRLSSFVCVRRRGGRSSTEIGSGSRRLGCRCLFGLGVPELVVIAGVAALVFGPKQLPEVGRNIGKTIKSFQQAAKEFETELKKEPEAGSEPSPAESPAEGPKAVSSGDEKQKLETSGTKENV